MLIYMGKTMMNFIIKSYTRIKSKKKPNNNKRISLRMINKIYSKIKIIKRNNNRFLVKFLLIRTVVKI